MSSDLIEASRERAPVEEAPLEEAPLVMPSVQKSRHRWAVVLAGGDGTRADLGSPTRVMDILARNNIQPTWLGDGHSLSLPPAPDSYRYQACRDNMRQDLAAGALISGKELQR
jgi:hypothetical protein